MSKPTVKVNSADLLTDLEVTVRRRVTAEVKEEIRSLKEEVAGLKKVNTGLRKDLRVEVKKTANLPKLEARLRKDYGKKLNELEGISESIQGDVEFLIFQKQQIIDMLKMPVSTLVDSYDLNARDLRIDLSCLNRTEKRLAKFFGTK